MNVTGPTDEDREIALVLTSALAPAIAPSAPGDAFVVAREVAQMLTLEGLDRLLGVCEGHAGAPWPESIEPAIHRLARLCAAAEADGSVAPFMRADLELAGLAAELEALVGSPAEAADAEPEPAIPTLAVGDVLGDLPLASGDDARALQRVRLTLPVAGALRAALDWLAGSEGPRRALKVSAEDSMLEVWVSAIDPLGLRAASEVLAAADGNLGPVGGAAPAGTWRVRVPAHAARESYLMLVQGGLPLALPWHAVIHVHLMPEAAAAEAYPSAVVLAPLAPLAPSSGDRPVVMLAHGLRRAWLVADRLVWRFPAETCATEEPPPAPALDGLVRTDEGESWWRVDVARLLAGVEPLSVPDAPVALPPEPAPAREETPAPPRAPRVLTADAVRPLPAEAERARAPGKDIDLPPSAIPRAAEGWRPRTPPRPGVIAPAKVELIAPEPRRAAPPMVPEPPRAAVSAPAPPPVAPRPQPRELAHADVEPVSLPSPPPVAPAPAAPPVAPAPAAPLVAPAPAAPPVAPAAAAPAAEPASVEAPPPAAAPRAARVRRALVVEDSMMARLFLVRMLQKRGFQVDAVDSASALGPALVRGPWGVVCLDVELPDARGVALAIGVREQLEHMGSSAALVALVRDPADIAVARGASIPHTLRKPFAEIELDALLARLGLERVR